MARARGRRWSSSVARATTDLGAKGSYTRFTSDGCDGGRKINHKNDAYATCISVSTLLRRSSESGRTAPWHALRWNKGTNQTREFFHFLRRYTRSSNNRHRPVVRRSKRRSGRRRSRRGNLAFRRRNPQLRFCKEHGSPMRWLAGKMFRTTTSLPEDPFPASRASVVFYPTEAFLRPPAQDEGKLPC